MKSFKITLGIGMACLWALAARGATAPATGMAALETGLAWAQMMAEMPGGTVSDEAWRSYWRNEAGCFASAMILAQEDRQKAQSPSAAAPDSPADPNARFRAAPTPEENLARVPAPKITMENDYIPKLRPGEMAGVSVDYSRIDPMINRHLQDPTSTASVIPPVPVYGGWGGGWGGWRGGWGGWGGGLGVGYWGRGWGGRGYWAAPCAVAAPVYYDPYCCGGVSGGFFYRGSHFGIGVRF